MSDAFCSHFRACEIPEQCTRIHRVAPLFAHTFHSKFHEFIPFILERACMCAVGIADNDVVTRLSAPSPSIARHKTVGSISAHERTYPIFVPTVCVCKLCCLFVTVAAHMPAARSHTSMDAHRFQLTTLSSHFEVNWILIWLYCPV